MSKLAHSDQGTMDKIDRERAIRDGNEDCLPSGAYDCGWAAGYVDGINDKVILTDRLATYEAALRELLQSAEDATDMEGGTQSINLEMAIERASKALEDNT